MFLSRWTHSIKIFVKYLSCFGDVSKPKLTRIELRASLSVHPIAVKVELDSIFPAPHAEPTLIEIPFRSKFISKVSPSMPEIKRQEVLSSL